MANGKTPRRTAKRAHTENTKSFARCQNTHGIWPLLRDPLR